MAKVLLGFMGVGKSSVAPYLDGRFRGYGSGHRGENRHVHC